MAELRGLGAINDQLAQQGVRLIALSVDAPKDSKRVVEKNKLPFPILADEQREVLRSYGLVHAKGGPGGSDVAIPADILIDRDGKILWKHVSAKVTDRPYTEELLDVVARFPKPAA